MCGITGFLSNSEISTTALELATQKLAHRGPDASNTTVEGNVGLGHRRLSILDLRVEANQPMRSQTGRFTMVFNGEVFNHQAIRQQLEKEYSFSTSSDTETVLAAFEKWGVEAFEKFNGFWAMAIYDKKENSLTLSRDRYGVKPLLIYEADNQLFFSSELKSLMAFPFEKKIDMQALNHYLRFNYQPSDHSILENVTQVSPGMIVSYAYQNGRLEKKQKQYYQVSFQEQSEEDFESAAKNVRELVEDATQLRLLSDVPVGGFLSGGIDSSIVTWCAAQHQSNFQSFTIGFPENPWYNEADLASKFAKYIGAKNEVIPLTMDGIASGTEDVLDALDAPFADSSALAVFQLCKQTRQFATVALSGDAADEIFGGYRKHVAEEMMLRRGGPLKAGALLLPIIRSIGSSRSGIGDKFRKASKLLEAAKLSPQERYLFWASFWQPTEFENWLTPEYRVPQNDNRLSKLSSILKGGSVNETLHADQLMVLPGDMLQKVDKMSMVNSLEVRSPFTDYRLVDYVNSLPANYKVKDGKGKLVLRKAFDDILPDWLVNQPKRGFEVPLQDFFNGQLNGLVFDEVLGKQVSRFEIVKPEIVAYLKQKNQSNKPGDAPMHIWNLTVLHHWLSNNM